VGSSSAKAAVCQWEKLYPVNLGHQRACKKKKPEGWKAGLYPVNLNPQSMNSEIALSVLPTDPATVTDIVLSHAVMSVMYLSMSASGLKIATGGICSPDRMFLIDLIPRDIFARG
jgi:hypothetical protein